MKAYADLTDWQLVIQEDEGLEVVKVGVETSKHTSVQNILAQGLGMSEAKLDSLGPTFLKVVPEQI